MESRTLDIMLLSAKGLKNVKHITKMNMYVVVKISGDSNNSEQKTHVDKGGGANPTWDFPMQFTIDEASALNNNLKLVFKFRCDRTVRGDKDVGEFEVPLKELLDNNVGTRSITKVVSYKIQPKGEFKFSYKLGDIGSGSGSGSSFGSGSGSGPGRFQPQGYPTTGQPNECYPPVGQPTEGYPPSGYPSFGQPTSWYPPSPAGYPVVGQPTVGPPPMGYPTVAQPLSSSESLNGALPQQGFEVVQPERTNEIPMELLVSLADAIMSGELVIETTVDPNVSSAKASGQQG